MQLLVLEITEQSICRQCRLSIIVYDIFIKLNAYVKLPHVQTSESWCKVKQDAGHSRPLQVFEFFLHHIP